MRLDVLETVSEPDRILAGGEGELLAVQDMELGKFMVVYREVEKDGFIITAFITRRTGSLDRRKLVWP